MLPIRGTLRWRTRVKAVLATVHSVEELVGILTRGHLGVVHFVILRTQSLS